MATSNDDEIKLKTGASATITLKGLTMAGYKWNYIIDGDKDCINLSQEYRSPAKLTGASADEVFTITAQKKGTVIIYFSQRRSWEKNVDPVKEKKITVIIE